MIPYKNKIAGIILAAGTGSRMKCTKQLLELNGKPVLSRVINHALGSVLDPVIVVLGHDYDTIKANINMSQVLTVRNKQFQKGQSTSLITGLTAVPKECLGAMFLLADQVLIDQQLIDRLSNSFLKHKSLITIPIHKEKRGNPVIIAKELFPELLNIKGDTGARSLFKKYHNRIHFENVSTNSIHLDMDTINDYKRIKKIIEDE